MGRFSDGDPEYLKNEQYSGSSNLRTRIKLHELFSTNPYGWHRWVFDRFRLPDIATVLDVGCGSAALWRKNLERVPSGWTVVLADFSSGMLRDAVNALGEDAERFTTVACDARALPLRDEAFDAVIANHMLYHVPDRPAALSEIRRVLRSDGTFFASTVGLNHLQEVDRLVAWRRPGPSEFETASKFGLENGAGQLGHHFATVDVETYDDSLEVTDVAPLLDYIGSMPLEVELDDSDLREIAWRAERKIATNGSFHITKSSAIFIARK